MSEKKFTYKDAGVNIEAGEELVRSIKDIVKETHNTQVVSNIGGFGGLFMPDLTGYKQPVLVSSVDGVGTKLIVAFKHNRYDTVGQDLVNHCVNDIAVCGAKPLYFLDYFSTGTLDQHIAYDVIKGFTIACKENNCALIGGETAEMPDIYKKGEFDLAGTIVGIVEKDDIIDGSKTEKGDVLIGLPSNGLHTNGYSLARKVLFSKYDLNDDPLKKGTNLGDELLKVHKSYLSVIQHLKNKDGVKAFSHITGGGIVGNTKRVLKSGLKLSIDWNSWDRPWIFKLIKQTGNVPEEDMQKTFNLGVGLVVIVSKSEVESILYKMKKINEEAFKIGEVV